ncbi:MAG TPA: glycerate kinase [Bacteroides sp.]|nr:glycerate kinase [Bacteroides sp.]
MKILIAPDSFKNALSALDVAHSLEKGILRSIPEAETRIVPMADGGEGTVESLIDATGGKRVNIRVKDPLSRDVESSFGITGDGSTAVIEMAAASGIQLIKPEEKDPWNTTTYGTGELIKAALDSGCRTILLGIGGSATNDCGSGMATALGVKFMDKNGNPVNQGGGALAEVERIDMGRLDPRIAESTILVACDVTNPLTGPQGASCVYGPQKGADDSMVKKLDENLSTFARVIKNQLGKEVGDIPGAGAAGGLGAGLIAFLDAKLVEGVPAIAERIGLEDDIKWADLVITGEGGMDFQTQYGKTPYGVAQIARKYNKPVIAVAGTIGEGADVLYDMGISAMYSILESPMSLNEAIAKTPLLLETAGERIGRILLIGK